MNRRSLIDFFLFLYLFLDTGSWSVDAYASSLSCGTSLTAGTSIMGASTASSSSRTVTLTNSGGDTLTDGDTYTAGESSPRRSRALAVSGP